MLIHYFGSGGQSAPIRRTVRGSAPWPTMVNIEHIDFPATSPYPRTVRDSLADGPLVHLWCVSCAQKFSATYPRGHHASATPPFSTRAPRALSPSSHSLKLLSLSLSLSNPKPWRSFTLSSTIEASSPRRSIAGDRRRRTTPPDLFFFLGEELP